MSTISFNKFMLLGLVLAVTLLSGCASGGAANSPDVGGDEAVPAVTPSEPEEPAEPELPEPTVATLAVCGDVMSHLPVVEDAWDQEAGRYDYGRIMAAAAPYVSSADYAVANLETTLAGGPP